MKNPLCVFAVISAIVSPALAQELRKPMELIELVVKSTYTAKITAAVDSDGEIYVWFDYDDITKDGGRNWVGFTAQKLQVYEKNKLVKEVYNLKDIPKYESVGINAVQMTSTVSWSPSGGGGQEYDNKITLRGMTELGLTKDEFILGPFNHEIIWARPVGQDKNGFLYVIAECHKKKDKEIPGEYKWRRFQILYKVDKESGGIADSCNYSGILTIS